MENLKRSVTSKKIESVIKKLPTKSPGPDGLTGKFYQIFKDLMPTPLKLFQKN